ncbi:hypothetical protein [Acinetobacter sp.]|uniref:hypothetical protein n=1 Tax=Acinetobacter sp. TaxID=472 RepID=UPI003D0174CA
MNYKCDIYAYEHVDGYFIIHVASNRIVEDLPPFPTPLMEFKDFKIMYDIWNDASSKTTHKEIGLPYDGETFTCDTLEELREMFMELREMGYIFPDSALELIDDEIKERDVESKD